MLAGQTLSLNARNSSTDAVRNLSGTNSLGASITFRPGGNNYWVQSDAGQLTLAGTITSIATGGRTLTLKGVANGLVSGVIEDGSAMMNVAKADGGTWTLAANNTYTGTTTVNGGTLLVNGTISSHGAVTVNSNGTLGGQGIIFGPMTVSGGGTLRLGTSAIARLTVSNNITLNSGATNVMRLSKSARTNDSLAGMTNLTYGGTLRVTNLAGLLGSGDSFKLFSAVNYLGTFTSLELPLLGDGLAWSNRLTLDGTLAVVVVTPPTINWQTTSGNTMTLFWPAYYTGFRLQTQTDSLNQGLGTNWVDVPGATNGTAIVPITNLSGATFFRLVQ